MLYKYWFICLLICLVFADSGGPDAFGYRWIDSREPGGPVFDWIDITETGTALSGGDDITHRVLLSDIFEYYGIDYDTLSICSNGWVAPGYTTYATYYSYPLPNTSYPNNMIAMMWGDLISRGNIYYQGFPDKFVVLYDEITELGGSSPPGQTFEVILYYARREILMQFLDVEPFSSSYRVAYVGIENATGTIGLNVGQWTSTGGILEDSLAIRFRATPLATVPYFHRFESDDGDFELEDGWEMGYLPATSPAFPPASGSRCLATVLTDDYSNNADWVVITPHISAVGIDLPIIDFMHYYEMEEEHDGGLIEVSTDEGSSWSVIEPVDGYPATLAYGPMAGFDAFSGTLDEWEKVFIDLSEYSGMEIMMRYHFVSDGSGTEIGWYIDNFSYYEAFGVIEGNVDLGYYEPDSGYTIEIVDLGPSQYVLDLDGYFYFDTVAVGDHYLRVSKDGYVTRDSIHFSMDRFDTLSFDILLAPELYSEDFEEDNGNMVAEPEDGWQWGVPLMGPDSTTSGINCWGTNLSGNYSNNASWMLTLQVPLYDVNWPLLSFWTWYQIHDDWYGTLFDGGNIKASIDTGETWEIVYPAEGYDGIVGDHNDHLGGEPAFGGMVSGDFWHKINVPLYHFSGNPTIWIMFELGTDGAQMARGWYIDDVVLAEDSTYADIDVCKAPEKPFLAVYPNPFNSTCNISIFTTGSAALEVLDITGKINVEIHIPDEPGYHNITWDAGNYSSGIYLLRFTDSGRKMYKKLILLK